MLFIVDRAKWDRGRGPKDGLSNWPPIELLNITDRKLCLVGFCALGLGLKPEDIEGVCGPDDLPLLPPLNQHVPLPDDPDNIENTPLSTEAIALNDEPDISDPARERMLTRLFADHGHQLLFVDGAP